MATLTWTAVSGMARSVQATGGASDTLDTTSTTDGMAIDGVGGFDTTISADSGATISTAFNLEAYIYKDILARWVRAKEYDIPASTGVTGVRDNHLRSFKIYSPRPGTRIGYSLTAGAVSAGNVTITIAATDMLTGGAI